MTEHRAVVGVDFGTLSGRAVVVRVDDGAELGSAVHEYAHGVIDETLPGTGRRLPHDWALQVPSDYLDVLRNAVPKAVAMSGLSRRRHHRHRHRLHRLHRAADARRRHAAVRAARAARPPARLRQAVEAPRRAAAGRPDQRARRTSGASPGSGGTAAGCPRSGSSPRACSCWRRTRRSTRAPSAGSRRPTGSCGSCAEPTCATSAPPATRRSTRTAATRPGTSWPRSTSASSTSSTTRSPSRSGRLGDPAGGLTEEAARWTGLRPGIAVAVGNVDAHVTVAGGAGDRAGPDGRDHGHVDLPRDEQRRAGRGAGHVRRGRGGIAPGLWGYEAGQSGVGDIFAWFVEHERARASTPSGPPRTARTCTST